MIHIEGCASQDMAYLSQYFVFLHQDPNLTRIIPNLNNLEYGYMNKFGTVTFTKEAMLIAGQYKFIFPFTIILPEYAIRIKRCINKCEEIQQMINNLHESRREIDTIISNIIPERI